MQPSYSDIFCRDETKHALVFIPVRIEEIEYYLRVILHWAYKAPKLDDRLNELLMFSLLDCKKESLDEFLKLLKLLTLKFAIGIGNTQYLYPTAMERFYVIIGNTTDLRFNEVYSLGRRDAAFFVVNEISLEKLGLISIRRSNLRGASLAIAIVKNSFDKDLVSRRNEQTNKTELISGLSYDVITSLKDALNFSINVTTYEKGWNEVLYNSSYQNMGKVLSQEQEDVFILKSTFIVARAKNFKILMPHHTQGIYAFFLKPSVGSSANIFLSLLRPRVWVALAVILFLIGASKVAMDALVAKFESEDGANETFSTIINTNIMWMVSLVTQQLSPHTITSASMRILLFCASMLVLLCFVALTAKLTSTLTITTPSFRTFFELIRTNLRIAADQESIVARYTIMGVGSEFQFDQTNAMILKRNKDRFTNMTEGAKLMLAGSHMFIGYEDMKTVLLNQFNRTGDDFCGKISSLPVHNLPFRSGMVATEKFPYKEFFNAKIIVLIQSGLLNRFNRHFAMDYSPIICHNSENGKLLVLQDIYFAHVTLLLGTIFSLGLCIFERLFHRRTISTQNSDIAKQYYA